MTNLSLTAPYIEPLEGTPARADAAAPKAARADAGTAASKPKVDAATRRQGELAAAALAGRNEELWAEQIRLQEEIQDLKIYINGRYSSWLDLHGELTKYRDALAGMDRMVQARDASIARQDAEKRQLELKLLELDRRAGEVKSRRNDRERADAELERQLADRSKDIERLKAEHANVTAALEEARSAAAEGRRRSEALEDDVVRRDESIKGLLVQLEQTSGVVGEISTVRDELRARVAELEREIGDRAERAQHEHEDLRRAHEQLQHVQAQLADRTAQLAASQEGFERQCHRSEELESQLHAARQQAEQIREDLARLEAHAAELGRLHAEARSESERLHQELASREQAAKLEREQAAKLEPELRIEKAMVTLLEGGLGRMTDIGPRLQSAANDRLSAPPPSTPAAAEQAPSTASDVSGEAAVAPSEGTAGDDDDSAAAAKLVAISAGQAFEFPLRKSRMTVGRGRASDIRIDDHFVSRLHAMIETTPTGTFIEDAASRNGIFVNSQRVTRSALRDGDVVCLGGELKFRFVAAAH